MEVSMISDELKKIISTFESQGVMNFLDPASEEQISQFEKKNGIRLPEKYREWLRFSDGGEFFLPAGTQMYGVAHLPLIDVADEGCPDDKHIVVGRRCNGDPVMYEKGSETFAIYFPDEGKIGNGLVYNDYFDFLNDLYDVLGIAEDED